jgi:hypothetical protein
MIAPVTPLRTCDEIDYARARNAKGAKQPDPKGSGGKQAGGKPVVTATSIFALAKNPALVLFTAATVLFQLADRGSHAAIWMSGLIVVPLSGIAASISTTVTGYLFQWQRRE